MPDVKFMTATLAHCAPAYLETAFEHCDTIAKALRAGPAATARYGMLQTGDHVGHVIFLASYASMADVQSGWEALPGNPGFQQMIADEKSTIILRNVVRLEDVSIPVVAAAGPGYGVLTRLGSPTPMVKELQGIAPILAENGAQIMRYGTLVTGSSAGRRLMAVGYPSLEAVEATYAALNASDDYLSVMARCELDFRNIVRLVG